MAACTFYTFLDDEFLSIGHDSHGVDDADNCA